MAKSQTGFDMLAYKHEGDKQMAGVMPDSWEGHARIAAMEATEDFSQGVRELARQKAEEVARNNPEAKAATIGKAARLYVEKHF